MLFGNLSEKTQEAMMIAAVECQLMKHFYLGTEHIFVGLCKVEDEALRNLFDELNIDPIIRRQLREVLSLGEGPSWGTEIILTPRVQRIAKLSDEICRTYKTPQTTPLHLLLALLRAGDGVAVRFLRDSGFDIDNMASTIEQKLEHSQEQAQLYPSAGKTPLLNKIGRDLTHLARQGKLDPVIGRNEEIRKIGQILTMKKKNNPVLVGEAGVGKTAVVEGLALKLLKPNIAKELKGLRIIEISLTALVAGTKYRGDFEQRILKMIDEASKNKDVILFIDELHNMIGAGSAEGAMDASNILKPVLARGEIRCIGATTIAEYRRYIEKDAALERRFQPVHISEPSGEEALQILDGLRESYESHYNLKITDEAIRAAVDLSIRYLHDRYLPDKAIDLIDQASAKKRLKSLTLKSDLLDKTTGERDESATLRVTGEDIAKVVAEWKGIPISKLTEDETERLLEMEKTLTRRVIGQEQAIKALANTIRTAKAGLANPNRPMGVFLFLGPTGVGKTELAKALAEFLFDDEKRMIRFDMSEYMEQHTVSKLIGSPPGYVGHEQEGLLTGAVRTRPYSVILFDEIEKAHHDVQNLFLQIFDEGRLTDSKGKEADFTNTIIVMTSNVVVNLSKKQQIGFVQPGKTQAEEKADIELVTTELKKVFRVELLNRIDRVILFDHLGKEEIRLIIDKLLSQVQERISQKGLSLTVSDEVYDFLMKHGYSETYGAREMDRVIQRMISEPLAEALLKGRLKSGDQISLKIESDKIVFQG